jgi:hypothetical protein
MMELPTTFDHETLHNIINNLAVIVSFTELLEDQIAQTDLASRALAEIRNAALGAATLLGRPLPVDET